MSRYTGWDDAAVRQAMNKPPRAKYGSKKVQIDGIGFDSKSEGARYSMLMTMWKAGLIRDLKWHPEFQIWIKGIFICIVELDFSYFDIKRGVIVYEDVKVPQTMTAVSNLKRKMCEAEYGITVELIR